MYVCVCVCVCVCGVVWCGVVWCDVMWCGVVWCGVVWCGVVWCGVVWCGVVWCGVVWRGVVCVGVFMLCVIECECVHVFMSMNMCTSFTSPPTPTKHIIINQAFMFELSCFFPIRHGLCMLGFFHTLFHV